MFGNFIYFIVVLLIYSTYQPSETITPDPVETLSLIVLLALFFTGLVRWTFRRLQRRAAGESLVSLDYRFSAAQGRLSVLAIILFTVDIYGLHLPSFLAGFYPLALFPTLSTVLGIALFVGYLAVIWYHAHPVHRLLGSSVESRRAFIRSNIAFSIPVLIPWFILSLILDLLALLPFDFTKGLVGNPAGELAFFSLFLLAIAVAAPALIQRFWGCTPLAPGLHRNRIEAMCRKAQVTCAEILNWPIFGGRMLTAGVMGLVSKFRYILVTDALLENLTVDEVDAVIAHEIGHVKRHHLQYYLLFFVGFLLLFYAFQDILLFAILYLAYLLLSAGLIETVAYPAVYAVFNVAFIALFLLYFRYLFGFFVRNFERQADAYVFKLMPSAGPLIRSLQKVAFTSGQAPDKPNWHHFSITERIDFLKKCEDDRRHIKAHDRKVKNSLTVCALFLCLVTAAGWFVTPNALNEKLTSSFHEKLLILEIEKSPGKAVLYHELANIYLLKEKFSKAITAYKHALWLAPDFAEALNNLAWLYATCKDETLRDPEEALRLALAAAERNPRAHVLDTLAECYYVNGKHAAALLAARQALGRAEENRSYYLKQVQRFEKAQRGVLVKRPEVGQE